jgi:hypothetical protein
LGARLMNVLATPGDVFAEVRAGKPCTANWLVPLLISCAVALASVQIIFSLDTVQHQVMEQRDRALDKQLANVPKAQAEQARAMAEKFSSPTMMRVFGSFGAVGGSAGWLFLVALVLWGVGRVALKGNFSYVQTLEVCGLAQMVNVFGAIVSTLLVVGMGSLYAQPGLALVVREFDPANRAHVALASVNAITFWYMAVLAVGLAKLSGRKAWTAFAWLFGLWLVWRGTVIALGLGAQGWT